MIKRNDAFLGYVALAATLTLTAYGEWLFATRTGWPWHVALAMPVSVDVYVVLAYRMRRDTAPALLLMATTNVCAHLVTMVPGAMVDGRPVWQLVAAASILPPVVLWRVHRLTQAHPSEKLRDTKSTVVVAAQDPSEQSDATRLVDPSGTRPELEMAPVRDARPDPSENLSVAAVPTRAVPVRSTRPKSTTVRVPARPKRRTDAELDAEACALAERLNLPPWELPASRLQTELSIRAERARALRDRLAAARPAV